MEILRRLQILLFGSFQLFALVLLSSPHFSEAQPKASFEIVDTVSLTGFAILAYELMDTTIGNSANKVLYAFAVNNSGLPKVFDRLVKKYENAKRRDILINSYFVRLNASIEEFVCSFKDSPYLLSLPRDINLSFSYIYNESLKTERPISKSVLDAFYRLGTDTVDYFFIPLPSRDRYGLYVFLTRVNLHGYIIAYDSFQKYATEQHFDGELVGKIPITYDNDFYATIVAIGCESCKVKAKYQAKKTSFRKDDYLMLLPLIIY